jgi:uncharacterized membrane protein
MHLIAVRAPSDWRLTRLPLWSLAAYLIGMALLAGAIHIVAILLVPYLAEQNGWSRLVDHAGEDAFAELPAAGSEQERVPGLDPLFVNGACRLNLDEAPAGITVDARDRFWSVALYDPQGTIVFSLNDRTAVQGRLDMIVVNPAQNERLREAPTIEVESTIIAESPSDDLVAILRLYAPTRPVREDARRIMAEAECLPAPSVIPSPASG